MNEGMDVSFGKRASYVSSKEEDERTRRLGAQFEGARFG